ncbi:hypothetical protein D3C72_1766600 [compost metagenome]
MQFARRSICQVETVASIINKELFAHLMINMHSGVLHCKSFLNMFLELCVTVTLRITLTVLFPNVEVSKSRTLHRALEFWKHI